MNNPHTRGSGGIKDKPGPVECKAQIAQKGEAFLPGLGTTPRQYLDGGQAVSISYALAKTSLGWLLIAPSERGVCAIELGGSAEQLRRNPERTFPQAELQEHKALLKRHLNRIRADLNSPKGLHLPLDIRGTASGPNKSL